MNDRNLLEQLRLDAAQRDGGGGGKHRYGFIAAAVILAVFAAGGLAVLKSRPVAVETVVLQAPSALTGGMAVLDATGYVTARREATVSFKITGKLADVLVDEGDEVRQGQVLAVLDDTDEQTRLRLAQAQLSAIQAQVGQLDAEAQQAERNLKRQQELNARGLASTQALEDARTRAVSLNAQLQAQRKLIDVAAAELQVARVNLDNTIIYAPFSGVVVDVSAQPGEIVSPVSAGGGFTRTGICTIVDMDSLEIEVDVNEAYINRVRPGQAVIAVLDAYPDWQLPAEVIAIIPTADRSKATVRVRIALRQKDARIVPDMGVRVSFLQDPPAAGAPPAQGVLVPVAAIVQRAGGSMVFEIDGEAVRLRAVPHGQDLGDMRLIEGPLKAGARVVLNPPPGLEDGARVETRTPG